MTDAKPYSKGTQLHRPHKPYRRKIASAKGWQAITDAKVGPCRICNDPATNGRMYGLIQFHHIVKRSDGGDDVADNIVPLCPACHDALHARRGLGLPLMLTLTPAERAYVAKRGGQDYFQRAYGVEARP